MCRSTALGARRGRRDRSRVAGRARGDGRRRARRRRACADRGRGQRRKAAQVTRVRFAYEGPTRLSWKMVEGDLESMEGSWELEDLGAGRTRITYTVAVDPGANIPRLSGARSRACARDPRGRANELATILSVGPHGGRCRCGARRRSTARGSSNEPRARRPGRSSSRRSRAAPGSSARAPDHDAFVHVGRGEPRDQRSRACRDEAVHSLVVVGLERHAARTPPPHERTTCRARARRRGLDPVLVAQVRETQRAWTRGGGRRAARRASDLAAASRSAARRRGARARPQTRTARQVELAARTRGAMSSGSPSASVSSTWDGGRGTPPPPAASASRRPRGTTPPAAARRGAREPRPGLLRPPPPARRSPPRERPEWPPPRSAGRRASRMTSVVPVSDSSRAIACETADCVYDATRRRPRTSPGHHLRQHAEPSQVQH